MILKGTQARDLARVYNFCLFFVFFYQQRREGKAGQHKRVVDHN